MLNYFITIAFFVSISCSGMQREYPNFFQSYEPPSKKIKIDPQWDIVLLDNEVNFETHTYEITSSEKNLLRSLNQPEKQNTTKPPKIRKSIESEKPIILIKSKFNSYFFQSPGKKFPNCLLAPNRGEGSLSNISKGFIDFPRNEDLSYGYYELTIVKGITEDGKRWLIQHKIFCSFDDRGFYYPLQKTKTSGEVFNRQAAKNFGMFSEFINKYYPKYYELVDSHNSYTWLDDLLVGIVIPEKLSKDHKGAIYPIILITPGMMRTTFSTSNFQKIFQEALLRFIRIIEEESWLEKLEPK
jgi:hypothetical protein